MPCVLPVLSLKVMGVLKHGGGKTSHIRFSFFMSCLGIISSFMLLAAIVISFKNAGHSVGWGFQFQEPLFLISLIVILCLFAANEWDLFEITLPYWLGGRIDDVVQKHDSKSPIGHFITGAFATLLATPCSAPYLGTAITFALSQGTAEILLTFFVMGIGLSTPYLFFAVFPGLVNKMPKPGKWMIKVKHFFGILLLLTATWLITVLYEQIGIFSSALLVFCLMTLFWILKLMHKTGKSHLLLSMIISCLVLCFILPMHYAQTMVKIAEKQGIWEVFNEENITQHVKNGKIVFVDVTAEWCITCKYNKKTTVNSDEIMHILMSPDVIAMKADYTSPDDKIEQFLNKHQKYGIPFNIIYGPKIKGGISQPEILDKAFLIDSFKKAGYKQPSE